MWELCHAAMLLTHALDFLALTQSQKVQTLTVLMALLL